MVGIQDTDVGIVAFADETLTIAGTAVGLTASKYSDAIRAEMTLEDAQIRFWVDGTDPTSSAGHPVNIGDIINIDGTSQIINFKAIRTGATSGTLQITYFH